MIFLFKVFLTARTMLHRYVPGQYWELKYILQKEELMNVDSFLSHFFSAFLSSLLPLFLYQRYHLIQNTIDKNKSTKAMSQLGLFADCK